MTSSFTWLDYDERERRRMLDIISMFSERDTRDELGIGSIRDAFADMLFPGTSTIQTRARYFLFIPWMYRRLEQARTKSAQVERLAREEELRLIDVIERSDDTEGNIGRIARRGLQRLPSNIYWLGLSTWGIRRYQGSQDQYHRSLDTFYTYTNQSLRHAEDGRGDLVGSPYAANWDEALPNPPPDFPRSASMQLLAHEAAYLRGQIQIQHKTSDTLLAFLVTSGLRVDWVDAPWLHPQQAQFPTHIQEQLRHARNFAEVIHGAALLYNLMLAEKRGHDEWIGLYKDALQGWVDVIDQRLFEFRDWDITRFWAIVRSDPDVHVSVRAVQFVESWIALARDQTRLHGIIGDDAARDMVTRQEQFLKGGQARLSNQRALDSWRGAAGAGMLRYRWPTAWRLVSDIQDGLTHGVLYA